MEEVNKIQNGIVSLNIGGNKFTTSLQTLQMDPNSMLGAMFSGRHLLVRQDDGSIFLDRDGTHFRIILNYLRGNISSINQLPDDRLTLSDLLSEVDYYQLEGLRDIMKPEKKEKNIIDQIELEKHFELDANGWKYPVKELSFKNCRLDNLNFKEISFSESLDISNSSLINTTFSGCWFYDDFHYSFDRTDLNNCTFESCVGSGVSFVDLIINKHMTFYDAKNFELAKFSDEEVKDTIKNTYDL